MGLRAKPHCDPHRITPPLRSKRYHEANRIDRSRTRPYSVTLSYLSPAFAWAPNSAGRMLRAGTAVLSCQWGRTNTISEISFSSFHVHQVKALTALTPLSLCKFWRPFVYESKFSVALSCNRNCKEENYEIFFLSNRIIINRTRIILNLRKNCAHRMI